MSIRFLLLLALFQALAFSQSVSVCDKPLTTCDDAQDRFPEENRISIKYANKTISKVEYFRDFVNVDITADEITTQYSFVVCGCEVEQVRGRSTIFINPVSLYIDSGPSLALYHFLAADNVAGITAVNNRDFIFNQDIRDHIINGGADEVSFMDESGFFAVNYTKIEEINPSLSIIDTFGFMGYDAANIDVPFLVNAEAQEQNPLARAEWLKLFGLVLDRVQKANEEFDQIEKRYNEAVARAQKAVRRPAVFFNEPLAFGGGPLIWTLPVTDEYIVQIIRDANADYRYIDEEADAGKPGAQFNLSTVVRDFTSADVLIQSNHFPASNNRTLEEYLDGFEEPKDPEGVRPEMEKLKAVRCATVWSNQKRITTDGMADDFFESAIVRPDEFLSDIIQALHPNLDFGDRETFFVYRYEAGEGSLEDCPNTPLLNGTAPEGEELVDTKFVVPELDRYEIADRLEQSVIPEIGKRVEEPFEVFFHHEDVSENDTVVTVRVQLNSTEKESFDEESSIIFAMRDTLGDGVRQRNDDGSLRDPPAEDSDPLNQGEEEDEEDEEDGGGLSGGAIAGIVIGVIVAVVVVGLLVMKRRSRGRMPVPADGIGGFDQEMTV